MAVFAPYRAFDDQLGIGEGELPVTVEVAVAAVRVELFKADRNPGDQEGVGKVRACLLYTSDAADE